LVRERLCFQQLLDFIPIHHVEKVDCSAGIRTGARRKEGKSHGKPAAIGQMREQ
jgi:hypothetical protein